MRHGIHAYAFKFLKKYLKYPFSLIETGELSQEQIGRMISFQPRSDQLYSSLLGEACSTYFKYFNILCNVNNMLCPEAVATKIADFAIGVIFQLLD